ncbi:hypothetical protein C5B90_02160 [Haloferax sp. Atlit-12N]|uniref:hypothetical protein n=1 Tax=Haloferax sp. Atlit-12N TaxID=2077203 RepID=UPI000E232D8F|nr:hypothetical protein [Haloferax sp. Atlit-12N]RDZ65195.1 hypothetical protein C5B90_02160 [Haloferax sp. Atlit-12N]
MPAYRRWSDYGARGVPPEALELAFDGESAYDLSPAVERAVERAWESVAEGSDRLFDGDLLNLVKVSDDGRRLTLGPARFRDYFVNRLTRTGHDAVADAGLTPAGRAELGERVHVLSSFVAVVCDDGVLLGVRAPEDDHGALVSFPGSGYLDGEEDVTDDGSIRPVREVVAREVEEELGLVEHVECVRCLGVFEDVGDATHYNPALFSVVEVDAAADRVASSIRKADDTWEFSSFATVPMEPDALNALVELSMSGAPVPAPLDGDLPESVTGATSKTLLMALLLGRYRFGSDWFESARNRHPGVEICGSEGGSKLTGRVGGHEGDSRGGDDPRSDGGYTQTDFADWYAEADEGDETPAWVFAEDEDGDGKGRARLMFDLVQKKVENHTQSRRGFLKTIGKSIAVTGGVALGSAGTAESLDHFWPNALSGEESENALDIDAVETLLFDSRLDWESFKTESLDMVRDPEIVTAYDDVHLLSVFFRSVDDKFVRAVRDAASQADTVYLYFADPVGHQFADSSALELHEDIELVSFRHLFSDSRWGQFYTTVAGHPENNRVPHPDSIALNRVRALANALRAIRTGVFFVSTMENVRVRLIDHHEMSLRGRLIGDHHGAFVLNPKATIGTTPPRAGFVTQKDVILGELHEERKRITTKETYDRDALTTMSETVRERIDDLLGEAVADGELGASAADEIRGHVDALTLDDPTACDVSLEAWQSRDEGHRSRVREIRRLVNLAQPFELQSTRGRSTLAPGALFSKIEASLLNRNQP